MTGRGKKTQSTSQRSTKNNSSRGGGAGRNIISPKNLNATKTKSPASSSNRGQTEEKDLKRQISELQSKVEELSKENKRLQSENDKLNNDLYLSRNDEFLQNLSKNSDGGDSQAEAETDDTRPAKRRKKASDEEEKAKTLMRTLMKGYPAELNIKYDETFKSKVNVEICEKLIPKLRKDVKSAYNLSYEQVGTFLQSIHRVGRNSYMKSNQDDVPDTLHSQVEAESDSATRSAKRQTKPKGKKPGNLSEDEEGAKTEDVTKIDEGAKALMKALIKGYPPELTLLDEETFKSESNANICKKLIPKLQKDTKSAYNLSHEQVAAWLQNFHKNKRKAFLKSDHMVID